MHVRSYSFISTLPKLALTTLSRVDPWRTSYALHQQIPLLLLGAMLASAAELGFLGA